MRQVELLVCLGIAVVPETAWAQPAPVLTCRDAIEEVGRKPPDAYDLAALTIAVSSTFKDLDATRIGSGSESVLGSWTPEALTGEEMAVLLSCRAYPVDTLPKRAAEVFNEYVARHQS